MSCLPTAIVDEADVLFHDARLIDVDPVKHERFIIERVLDRGTMQSVRALFEIYGEDRIRNFFREGGAARVSRRTMNLWKVTLNLSEEECTPKSSPRISSPFWTH